MNTASDAGNPTRRACPPTEQLQRYALMNVSGPEFMWLTQHIFVERCEHCDNRLHALPEMASDGLATPFTLEASDPSQQGATHTHEGRTESYPPGDPRGNMRGKRLERYRLCMQIGRGGFAVVYSAWEEELERYVAVKIPFAECFNNPILLQACRDEAKRLAQLDHPNILPIYGVGSTAEIPFFLVSKLVPGENLHERLKRCPMKTEEVVRTMLSLTAALEFIHKANLIHRDIKPRNILIEQNGNVYLADFGLATPPIVVLDAQGERHVAGTPGYLSPEQARGISIDHRSDIFSLGIVMYEMLTGVRAFTGSEDTLRDVVLLTQPIPPRQVKPEIPLELERICLRAIAPDPALRYPSANDLEADLKAFAASQLPRQKEHLRPQGRAAMIVLAAATCVLALFCFGILVNGCRENKKPLEVASSEVLVSIDTKPGGAEVAFFQLDPETGRPKTTNPTHTKAGKQVSLLPGEYLVVAVLKGKTRAEDRFHEVYRTVPSEIHSMPGAFKQQRWEVVGGCAQLSSIELPETNVLPGMSLFPASKKFELSFGKVEFREGQLRSGPKYHYSVPAFHMDWGEVTTQQHQFVLARQRHYKQPKNPTHAQVDISWEQAVAVAEVLGKRLPDEVEFEYAATGGGKSSYPFAKIMARRNLDWGKIGPVGELKQDEIEIPGQQPVYGLYSNAGEWMGSWADRPKGNPDTQNRDRLVRGMWVNPQVHQGLPPAWPADRLMLTASGNKPTIGVRCVRSVKPRLKAEDFLMRVD